MPSRYSPVPGTGRCTLCREVEGPDHVRHPWSQIVLWLWHSDWLWRTYLITGSVIILTLLIAAVRILTPL